MLSFNYWSATTFGGESAHFLWMETTISCQSSVWSICIFPTTLYYSEPNTIFELHCERVGFTSCNIFMCLQIRLVFYWLGKHIFSPWKEIWYLEDSLASIEKNLMALHVPIIPLVTSFDCTNFFHFQHVLGMIFLWILF